MLICIYVHEFNHTHILFSSSWSDAGQWINHTLMIHIHQNPVLHLVGLPRLQYTRAFGPVAGVLLGNSSAMTHQILSDLHMADWRVKQWVDLLQWHDCISKTCWVCIQYYFHFAVVYSTEREKKELRTMRRATPLKLTRKTKQCNFFSSGSKWSNERWQNMIRGTS